MYYFGSQSVYSTMHKCVFHCTEVKMLKVQKKCKAEVRKNNHHKIKQHIAAERSKNVYFVVEMFEMFRNETEYIFGFISELDKLDTSTAQRVAARNRNL